MSLVWKSDVKNYLSPHHQKEIHLDRPVSQPDATGFSVEEPACTDSYIEGQHQQPSTSGPEATSLVTSPDSSNTVVPTISRSVQV
jgi:hypothetical protein